MLQVASAPCWRLGGGVVVRNNRRQHASMLPSPHHALPDTPRRYTVDVWYDQDLNRLRIDSYGGMQSAITNGVSARRKPHRLVLTRC